MNFDEAIIHGLIIQAKSIEVEVIAMQVHDAGSDNTYTEQSYLDKARSIASLANEIMSIARKGSLS